MVASCGAPGHHPQGAPGHQWMASLPRRRYYHTARYSLPSGDGWRRGMLGKDRFQRAMRVEASVAVLPQIVAKSKLGAQAPAPIRTQPITEHIRSHSVMLPDSICHWRAADDTMRIEKTSDSRSLGELVHRVSNAPVENPVA